MKLVRVVAVVLLVLAAGTAAVAAVFGERLLAAAIERAGPALVGRDVRVGGVSIDWGFPTSVAATDLVVADADRGADAPMLRADRAEVAVEPLELLRLRFSPVRLVLRQPTLHLTRDERGRWNMPSAAGGGDGGSASGGGSILDFAAPREFEVEGGEVAVDGLVSPGVEARIAALSARGTPNGVEFRGTVGLEGGSPVAFSGEAGPLAASFGGDEGAAEPFPIRLAIGPETARLSAVGHLARPLDLAGVDLRIQAQGGDLAPLLAALTIPVVATPPFRFAARLTDVERGWSLRDLAARLGGSQVEGEASVLFAGRPRPFLRFDLAAPRVVPSDFGRLFSARGEGGAPSRSWADAELPTAWLRGAGAEGNLRVERLEGLAAEPAGLRAGIELKDGRLRVQPLRLELAGSVAEGSATVEAAADGNPPRAGLRLGADGLRLGPLMAAFGIGGEVTGTVRTASVDFRGHGTTPREIAAGLDGAARFRIAEGSVRVPGLAQLSMGLVETFGAVLGVGGDAGATPLACAIGDLSVRSGVVHVERLVVVTPRVAITGEGAIQLGEGTVRLTLTPSPLDEALLRVVVPVVISGGLASPEVATHPEFRVGARAGVPADVCAEEAGRR